MVRIARRVPADRDMDVAALAPETLVSQLDRLLASLPELPDPDAPPKSEPERSMEVRTGRDGWTRGRFCLPRRRRRPGSRPWAGLEDVEWATLSYVDVPLSSCEESGRLLGWRAVERF